MTHDKAKQAYTEAVAEVGGTIDFVVPVRKEGMH